MVYFVDVITTVMSVTKRGKGERGKEGTPHIALLLHVAGKSK